MDSKEKLNTWRKNWADITNKYLENNGYTERISEKSYAEQGIDKKPTIHEGYVARQMKEKGKVTDRILINNEIKKNNYQKQEDRKKYSAEEATKNISQSLSPKEKSQLKKVAKDLRIYVNYENLLDKERMLNNWEKSVETNQVIKPDENYSEILKQIEKSKDNLEVGKEILDKQFVRIYEKYYPELNEKQNYSTYFKFEIAQRTLKEDRVLTLNEIKETLVEAQNNELTTMLKTVYKNPYVQSVKNLQRNLYQAKQEVDSFYERNNISRSEVDTLPKEEQKEFSILYKKLDRQLQTIQVMDQYLNSTLKSMYPNLNLEKFSIQKKEQLSKAIDYYGNGLSLEKIQRIANEEQVNKFNTFEQRIGLTYLYKFDNNLFSEDDLNEIQNDYQLKEIYDVVSNESMREYFLNEVSKNGEVLLDSKFMFADGNNHKDQINLGFLLQNINLYEDIMRAQMDNLRNENEDKNKKRKQKKSKNKNVKQNRGMI